MTTVGRRRVVFISAALAIVGLAAGCTDDPRLESRETDRRFAGTAPPALAADDPDATTASAIAAPTYLGNYRLVDPDFGTEVTVTLSGGLRTIETNGLANHETGSFPDPGDPNPITERSLRYEFPSEPVHLGRATPAQTPGVATNGISFEPGTTETVVCQSGEIYEIEAIQTQFDLGLDGNGAHAQPDGTYHYHGPPIGLIESMADAGSRQSGDLTHIGFAADGFLIYASRSDALQPSYRLSTEPRSGTDCAHRGTAVEVDGTQPDGSYASDWAQDDSVGQLDRCNGIRIEGEYLYLVTTAYPYVPRCLMGDFNDPGRDGGGSGGGGAGAGNGARGGDLTGPESDTPEGEE